MRILEIEAIKDTICRSEDLLQGNNPIVLDAGYLHLKTDEF